MHPRYTTRYPIRTMKPVVVHTRISPAAVSGLVGCGALLAALLLAAGCAAPAFQPAGSQYSPPAAGGIESGRASNTDDTALLDALDGLPDSQRKVYDDRILEAGNSYAAASGCECRYVRVLDATGQPVGADRLACRNGARRFFAVDVFSTPPETRQRP
jgi:hypothetical protein